MPLTRLFCAHQLSLDLLNALQRFRQGQRDLADRALQPRQMRGIVDQLASSTAATS